MAVLDVLNAAAGALIANVLNSLVFAAGIGTAAWVFIQFARGVNAATRHVILWTVLLAVLAIPVADTLMSSSEPSLAVAATAFEPEEPLSVSTPSPASLVTTLPEPAEEPLLPFPFELRAGYLPSLLVALWAAVCAAQLVRVACSYAYLNRLKRESLPPSRDLRLSFDEWKLACGVDRDVRLLISDRVSSPLAAGFARPAIILPRTIVEKLSASDLDHVVLHELAHLARLDDWTNLIARGVAAIFGMHPIAAWILRRIDREREIACDDWVVGMTGAAKPYAASLARLIEFRLSQRKEMLATGIAGSRSELASRIERLVRGRGHFDPRTSMLRVNLSIAALALIVFAAAAQGPQWVAFAQDDAPLAPLPSIPAVPPVPPAPAIATVPPAPAIAPVPAVRRVPAAPPASWTPPAPPAPVIAEAEEIAAPFKYAYAVPPPPPAPPQSSQNAAPSTPPAPPQPPPPPARASDSGPSLLSSLREAGYTDLSVDEVIQLKNHGVNGAFITSMNKAGWGKLTTKQLIELRTHGISSEYMEGLSSVGMKNLTLRDAIDMRNHGVRPEWVREVYALGFGPYSVRQIIEFRNHGAKVEFFRALKDTGFVQADPKEIIEAVNHGLNASALRDGKKFGANLTLRQIIRLKTAGVI